MKNEQFITEFCKIVDQGHGQRPDKFWFATWMASKSPYFSFPKSFEVFWRTKTPPVPITIFGKIVLLTKMSKTLLSLLLKSTYLKLVMRQELQNLKKLRGQKINLLRTFSYNSDVNAVDPFWGELVNTLTNTAIPLLVVYDPNFPVLKCKNAYNPQRNNFPYLVFLSPAQLFKNFFALAREGFRQQNFNSYIVANQETQNYFNDAYGREILNQSALVNFAYYDCFKIILNHFELQTAYLPFENNPWEKMFHLAKKDSKKIFKTLGFQHASIQPGATNYLLSLYENTHKLYPDRILTVGNCTFQYLKNLPYYQNINLAVGCALRHSYLEKIEMNFTDREQTSLQLLVLLDGTPDTVELIRLVLNFADQNQFKNIQIKTREHPNLPIKKLYSEFFNHTFLKNGEIVIDKAPLIESLKQADLILYTGTTSCIEALKLGKGVINYNHAPFNYDPLFQFTDFKWEIKNSIELSGAISDYLALSDYELAKRRQSAKNFVNNYFSPCTREHIERFL